MWRYWAGRSLRRYGERYEYDVSYLLHVLDVSPSAFLKIAPLSKLALHREVVPAEAAFGAKLVGALAEDCGPCAQLAVNMAREAGVPDDQLEAVIGCDYEKMSNDTLLAVAFAETITDGSTHSDAARDAVRERWGERGVIDLTLATQVGRLFPMLKTGLGYGRSCHRVEVGGEVIARSRSAA